MKRIIYSSLSGLAAVTTVFVAAKAEVFDQTEKTVDRAESVELSEANNLNGLNLAGNGLSDVGPGSLDLNDNSLEALGFDNEDSSDEFLSRQKLSNSVQINSALANLQSGKALSQKQTPNSLRASNRVAVGSFQAQAVESDVVESGVIESGTADGEVVVPASGASPTAAPDGETPLPATSKPSPGSLSAPAPIVPASPDVMEEAEGDMEPDAEDTGIEEPGIEELGVEDAELEDTDFEDAEFEDAELEDTDLEDASVEDLESEDLDGESVDSEDEDLDAEDQDGEDEDTEDSGVDDLNDDSTLGDEEPVDSIESDFPPPDSSAPSTFPAPSTSPSAPPLQPSLPEPELLPTEQDDFAPTPETFPEESGQLEESTLVGEGFTPFQLSYLAIAGGLREEGIPGGDRLITAYKGGDLSATDIVNAGEASQRLGTAANDKDDYTKDVDRFLKLFRRDARTS